MVTDFINLFLAKTDFGQLPLSEPMPTLGSIGVLLGVILVFVNHFWTPKRGVKEVIGIRHNSVGSFPKEDVRKDLPLRQRLKSYREIDVDHSDSYAHGILDDHNSAIRRLQQVPQELNGLLRSAPDSPIAYYGLPHVPLAFYLGYLLSDSKYQVDLYDLNNVSRRWDQLSGISGDLEIETALNQIQYSQESGDVVVVCSVSYPIHESEIAELGLSNILATVEITASHPQRQLISNREQVDQVCHEFRQVLEAIKNRCPNRQRIHVFYAGPVSLSFALGQCVSERIDPEIFVYNYSSKSKPHYSWSLALNSSHNTSAEFHTATTPGVDHAAA